MPAFAWAIVLMVASYAIQYVIAAKPDVPTAATLADFDFPQSDEGSPQAVFFGDRWTEGFQVMWYGNLRTAEIRSGGKK
jgi:hypothetical protein